MTKKLKIATIGGGSSYTPELVEGFIKRYDKLPVDELWLVDIPEGREKLNIVGNLAKRMVEEAGVPMKIILTEDRREAIKDASFVTTQMRIGRLPARVLDERIPLSHGIIGQETNGAGGMFKAFRTIPVIFDIIKDIQELAPDAWMINFTNPSGMIQEAILNYTDFDRALGLCNVPINMHYGIADLLKVDSDDLELKLQGMNHFVFATDVLVKGESKMDELINIYSNITPEQTISMKNFMVRPFSASLIKSMRAIPCPYLSYYFFTKEQLETELEEYKEGRVRGEVVSRLEDELFELYKDENLKVKPPQLSERGGARYSDAACNLIESIYTDRKDIQYVNTRNMSTIDGLPYNSAVEVACRIGAGGAQPLATGAMPLPISGYVQMMKSFEQMVVKAAVEGDRDLAVAALDFNPLCPSDEVAAAVVDELFEAHKAYLPQFNL